VDNPGRFQIVLEDITSFVIAQLDGAIGEGKGRKFLPLCGGIFIFILIGNLMGQVPGLGSPTTNINVTFGCAITVWLYYHWQGIKAQGPVAYFKHFAFPPGVPKAMAPLMILIEPISHLSRVLSLTLRLFGNIFGEHLVVLIIGSLIPFLAPLPIQMLGLIVGPLQAFIFMILTAIYLSAAVAVDEHH
jgi:F-type H+-transporting ATPase subunit a